MRDTPYPARFFAPEADEPFVQSTAFVLPHTVAETFPLPNPLSRVLLLLMTLYLCCALMLIFTVSSYAAPLGSATISTPLASECVESAVVIAH